MCCLVMQTISTCLENITSTLVLFVSSTVSCITNSSDLKSFSHSLTTIVWPCTCWSRVDNEKDFNSFKHSSLNSVLMHQCWRFVTFVTVSSVLDWEWYSVTEFPVLLELEMRWELQLFYISIVMVNVWVGQNYYLLMLLCFFLLDVRVISRTQGKWNHTLGDFVVWVCLDRIEVKPGCQCKRFTVSCLLCFGAKARAVFSTWGICRRNTKLWLFITILWSMCYHIREYYSLEQSYGGETLAAGAFEMKTSSYCLYVKATFH